MADFIMRQSIRWNNGGQMGENVFHWQGVGTLVSGPMMAKGFIDNFGPLLAKFLGLCSEELYITSQTASAITGADKGGWRQGYFPGGVPGIIGGPPLFNSISPYVHWVNTETAKRQGRTFLPAPPADMIVDNALDAAYITELNAYGTDMLAGFSDGALGITYNLVLYRESDGNVDQIAGFQAGRIIGLLKKRARAY